MNQKKLVLAALALAILGGGIYVFSSNPPAQAPGMLIPSTSSVEYRNTEYGFSFPLPDSWKEYSIVTSTWKGLYSTQTVETGPMISIRHPLWTKENPRQDIPIMVFTVQQWSDILADKFHIGAAPIGPSELGRNAKYVFALPARYNFVFPTGFEEVEQILLTKPLQTL